MSKNRINILKKQLISVLLVASSVNVAHAQTIKVYPGSPVGGGVTFGADVKLTLFKITDASAVNDKFNELGVDLVRVPIVAHWGSTDNRYDTIRDYVADAKQQGFSIFASVANTNGVAKPDGALDDAHGADKFPNWLKCSGACAPSDRGLYDVQLSRYKNYLQEVVNNQISGVNWVGPWNEDPATVNDYTKTDFGKLVVGSELWSLEKSDANLIQLGGVIDIAGAHNYDNDSNLLVAYSDWKNFVSKGGDWFTESTLFGNSLAQGIAHMLPAISAGVRKVIIYQTVPRIVSNDGKNTGKFNAVKEFIANSKGKGAALKVETNNANYVAAAFTSGSKLILHVCNISASTATVYVNLQGYTVSTAASDVLTFGSGDTANVSFANAGQQVKVNLSGDTYARIILDNLAP